MLIQLDPISQVPFSETLAVWLPEALAHEIHHSVRTLTGPGFGNTLGAFLVSEGMASAFFHQAFPGTDAPWDNALTPVQEHALWETAQPLLTHGGLPVYSQWFYGGNGVPKWSGVSATRLRKRRPLPRRRRRSQRASARPGLEDVTRLPPA